MRRRELLQGFAALLPAAMGASSLLTLSKQAFALGGFLPALNQSAPAFELTGIAPAAGGEAVATRLNLADFQGKWLVLYFYPRDFTGGCTIEARGFQKDLASFSAANAAVVGVSADDAESHADFCSSEGLAFPLLSDPAGTVSRAYGSWMAPFSQRHTFLIDPAGILRSTWVAVRPSGHSTEVLSALQQFQAS